ncbi:hypothetical protein FKP32DRAFT_1590968 [Trametes sanguinea]|nr:hypothetical protein FKP32DRAFT_1590968 [Trametes sanguinea]
MASPSDTAAQRLRCMRNNLIVYVLFAGATSEGYTAIYSNSPTQAKRSPWFRDS